MRRILLLFALSAALVAVGCGGDDNNDTGGGNNAGGGAGYGSGSSSSGTKSTGDRVSMVGTSFSPNKLTVNVGDKITWRNDSDLPHNVVAESGATFKSSTFEKGGTFTFTPKKAGTIKYQCTIHSGMTGEITVQS